MESLPPEAPMAILSPRWKSALEVMVEWISASKAAKKHSLQTRWWVLGRRIRARVVWQRTQGEDGML